MFATNLTITASVQALLVPPSHNAVLYSLATGGTISISALFMAGVFPGLLLGFSLIILCLVVAYREGHPRGQTVPAKDALRITIDAAWGLITLVIILGGILGGIFTAIEAGAVACVWAFFVTMFIYRDYRWRDLPVLLHRTLRTVAMVLTLIACASSVGYVMALTQMPAKMTAFFLSISSNKYVILFLINILLLVLGTLVDMAPSILIATPILLPVMQNFGVDPVHFGMIMLLNLGIGLCHPPVGSILFVGCAVGKVTIEQVMRKIWPFYAVMFLVLMCRHLCSGNIAVAAAARAALSSRGSRTFRSTPTPRFKTCRIISSGMTAFISGIAQTSALPCTKPGSIRCNRFRSRLAAPLEIGDLKPSFPSWRARRFRRESCTLSSSGSEVRNWRATPGFPIGARPAAGCSTRPKKPFSIRSRLWSDRERSPSSAPLSGCKASWMPFAAAWSLQSISRIS